MSSNFEYIVYNNVKGSEEGADKLIDQAKSSYLSVLRSPKDTEDRKIKSILKEKIKESLELEKQFYNIIFKDDKENLAIANNFSYDGEKYTCPQNFENILLNKFYGSNSDPNDIDTLFGALHSVAFRDTFLSKAKVSLPSVIKMRFEKLVKTRPTINHENGIIDPGIDESEFLSIFRTIYENSDLIESYSESTFKKLYESYKKMVKSSYYDFSDPYFSSWISELTSAIISSGDPRMAEALALKALGTKKGKTMGEVFDTLEEQGTSGRGVIRVGSSVLKQTIDLTAQFGINIEKMNKALSNAKVVISTGNKETQTIFSELEKMENNSSSMAEGSEIKFKIEGVNDKIADTIFNGALETLKSISPKAAEQFQKLSGLLKPDLTKGIEDVLLRMNNGLEKVSEIEKLMDIQIDGSSKTMSMKTDDATFNEALEYLVARQKIKKDDALLYNLKDNSKEVEKKLKTICTGYIANRSGDFSEIFFTLLISKFATKKDTARLLGSNVNRIGESMHTDVAYYADKNHQYGMQLKEYLGSTGRTIEFYEGNKAIFPIDYSKQEGDKEQHLLSRYVNRQYIGELNFLIVNNFYTNFFNEYGKEFEDSIIMPFIRYEDYAYLEEDVYKDLKNNFYVINGFIVPTSLILYKCLQTIEGEGVSTSIGTLKATNNLLKSAPDKPAGLNLEKDGIQQFYKYVKENKIVFEFDSKFQVDLQDLVNTLNTGL